MLGFVAICLKKKIGSVRSIVSEVLQNTAVLSFRSSEDEYCPPDQVEVIQSKTLECLHTVYGNLDVIYDYKDESRLLE